MQRICGAISFGIIDMDITVDLSSSIKEHQSQRGM
jgi:hypothetical protein